MFEVIGVVLSVLYGECKIKAVSASILRIDGVVDVLLLQQ